MHLRILCIFFLFISGALSSSAQKVTGSEEIIRYVGPWKVPCHGVAPMMCMQVAENPDGPFTLHYDGIQNFTYREGSLYKLKIKKESLDYGAPIADASTIRWTCIEVLETSPVKNTKPLLGTEFKLQEMPGKVPGLIAQVPGSVTITFNDNKISGNAGCNNYFGGYTLGDDDQLSFGPIGTTRKLCPPPEMDTEHTFTTRLGQTAHYIHADDRLIFLESKGVKLLVFEASP